MNLTIVGPGRIGRQLIPMLEADGHCVTLFTRKDYGDFLSRDYNPLPAVESLEACDALLLLAGTFQLNADIEQIALVNAAAPMWFAETLHEKFPQAQVITFLDSRIHRAEAALPENVRAYVESKRRFANWTLKAAKAWGQESGARVNGIALGPVLPPPHPQHSEKGGDTLTPRPTVQEIYAGINFLLASPSVTGQILYITAGQHLL